MSVISPPLSDEGNLLDLDETKTDESSPHPALLNDLIIERVFDNLCKYDVIRCRLVCQKWKSVLESWFKKTFRLCLHLLNTDNTAGVLDSPYRKSKHRPPPNLIEFFKISQSELPFTAVSFRNRLPWPPAELSDFFSTEGRFITDLRLWNISLKAEDYNNENNKILDSYDLTTLLGGIENLKRLTLKRQTHFLSSIIASTRWIVTFDKLETIQYIHIEGCTIDINTSPSIISPIELDLYDVLFLRENKALENILLNEIVSFENMEKVSLYSKGLYCEILTKISLDVSGSTVLKKALFSKIDLINFKESGCNIDDLDWSNVPFDKTTNMIIKQLSMKYCECVLNMLPNTLEKLSVRNGACIVEFREPTLGNISKPNIKILELHDTGVTQMYFPYLTQCFYNLEELVLNPSRQKIIDVDIIPPHHLSNLSLYEDTMYSLVMVCMCWIN